jgi:hypothetical protein
LGSYVLSSDCKAAVGTCITLCGIYGELTGTEADFLSPALVSFLSPFMNPAFFHAPISLHPLVCGSADQAAHYKVSF